MYIILLVRAGLLSFVIFSRSITAHTWVEQLNTIAANGTMVGAAGFPRGNVLRSNPSFSDTAMVQLIPPNGGTINVIDASQLMCRASQATQTQTNGSPRLSAVPGALVALRYQENGHVTLPQNQPGKPDNRGTNFVYYTTQSQATDKFLDIHRSWTVDGSGGDGRGRLISTQNFDDGQCYQVNGGTISQQRQTQFKHTANNLMGADLWCQQDIQIPSDAPVGSTITLYWVWDWPTMPGTAGFPNGKQEIYTTCMDIDIVASNNGNTKQVAAQQFAQQDFVSAAASSQFVNIADPTAVASPQIIPFSGVSGSISATGTSAVATQATSKVSVPAASPNTPVGGNGQSATTSAIPSSNPQGRPSFHPSGYSNGHPNHQSGPGATFTVYQTDVLTSTSTAPTSTTLGQSNPNPYPYTRSFNFSNTTTISPQSNTDTLLTTLTVSAQVTAIVTVVQTDMLTVTLTNTVNPKRESESTTAQASQFSVLSSSLNDTLTQSTLVPTTTLTINASDTTPSSSSSALCSKSEAAYRLRARRPLYILPDSDNPSDAC